MHLSLDTQQINQCREYAKKVVARMMTDLASYSTVTVERTVLRLLGIDGINRFDVPYPNVIIDHLKATSMLEKGAAFAMAHALNDTQLSPQAIAEAVDEETLDLSRYKTADQPDMTRLLEAFTSIKKRIDQQTALRRSQRQHPRDKAVPDKYVIVATGDIYEDIEQAVSAVENGADIIAVIRTTGQSLLDFVPHGATREGFGGTTATRENFRLMRAALDEVGSRHGRYVQLVNYASGLCMPEIAALGALERLDMMLNDSLYGIIFRDINMQRTLIDQYFSRVLSAYADIIINTGEDNYLTTSDAYEHAHTVIASQFINEQFALKAGMPSRLMGLGHAYEIDPARPDSFILEFAQAQLSRQLFPNAPLKYMPPTKHMKGDIFMGSVQNALFNMVAVMTHQDIHLLGMMTEAIHTPFMSDRALALDNAAYVARATASFSEAFDIKPNGPVEQRAQHVLKESVDLLQVIAEEGLFTTLEKGRFAGIGRGRTQGKGLDGVFRKDSMYTNPVLEHLQDALKEGLR